jgi:hypothetical protein
VKPVGTDRGAENFGRAAALLDQLQMSLDELRKVLAGLDDDEGRGPGDE